MKITRNVASKMCSERLKSLNQNTEETEKVAILCDFVAMELEVVEFT